METKIGAAALISYEEFEPLCRWQREEARDTLKVHLPEFKKEQLKVNISNRGILKVSGERTVDATKKSKFYKEVAVPSNCNTNDIQAKFANNYLYIIMPKNTNVVVPEQHKPEQAAAAADQSTKPENAGKDQAAPPPDLLSNQKDKMVPAASTKSKDHVEGEISVSKGKQLAKIAVNVGMPVAVLAALIAFVVYMYKSTILED